MWPTTILIHSVKPRQTKRLYTHGLEEGSVRRQNQQPILMASTFGTKNNLDLCHFVLSKKKKSNKQIKSTVTAENEITSEKVIKV